MQRRHLALVISYFLTCLYYALAGEDVIPSEAQEKLQAIYKIADAKLRDDSSSYRIANPMPSKGKEVGILNEPWIPKAYTIDTEGAAFLQIWSEGFQLRFVLNDALNQLIRKREITQQIPEFDPDRAVQVAKNYLNLYQIPLSAGLELASAKFNQSCQACWEVRWTRVINGYPWDDFDPVSRESLVVIFHEKEGLVCLSDDIYSPVPKSLDVVMTREEAITKATKCAPLVERTPFYKSARLDGFIVDEMKACDLKVAIPNYLLDPQRANWLRKTPPDETRLCWVIRFATVDGKAKQRPGPGKPIPPDIIIYLDAATGECVGANFT